MTAVPSLADLGDLVAEYRAAADGDTEAAKSCCAAVYGIDLVGLFLGESYHPGGIDLTRRLADHLDLEPGDQVLDVASGVGTTAVLLAAERRRRRRGRRPRRGAGRQGNRPRSTSPASADRAAFRVGDAERLPLAERAFDAVISECAFCTFPDKATAASEAARVLRPGGRLGLTDVWLRPDRLDAQLAGLAGRIACIADARPIDDTRRVLERAGLAVDSIERHDDALAATVELVETRLRALRLLDLPLLRTVNVRRGIELARQVGDVVARGDAGYFLLTAHRSR